MRTLSLRSMQQINVTLVRARAIDPGVKKIAKALSQRGYNVKLLVWDRGGRGNIESHNGYTICRFGLKAPHDKVTILFYLPMWWVYEFFFLLRDDSKVIHTCDLSTLIPAIIVKLVKKIKLCYTIYDFYAANLPKQTPHIVRNWVASVEKQGVGFADVLFLVDESRYEQVKGAQINKLVYIYNSPEDFFTEKLAFKSTSELILFYAGVIHKTRGLQYMINALRRIDNIRLIIAGIGPYEDIFKSESINSSKVQYIGWIPYEEVIKRSLSADILFALYDPEIPNSKYASPNKLFEAMMCEKPIIVNAGTTAARIVKKENCGLVVPYGDIKAIKDAILKLKNDQDLRQKLGENGRKAYEEKYSWDIMEKRLINAYSEIAKLRFNQKPKPTN